MRFITIIFLFCLFLASCVKRPSKSPEPTLEYKEFTSSKTNGVDDGMLVLGYEDGDGDIFRDKTTNIPNLIIKFYYYNSGLHKFVGFYDANISDTFNIAKIIIQPGEDGFKGKSIRGEIFVPMKEFRPADSIKIFKYDIFALDEGGHKSNIVTTPQFTVNY